MLLKIYFVQIVGLRSQTERISASSVEKVCLYSLTNTHNARMTLFLGKFSNHVHGYGEE